MSFTIPEHIKPLREQVLRFVEDHVIPQEQILYTNTPEADDIRSKLVDMAKSEGCGNGASRIYGRRGLPWRDYGFINEVIGRSDAAMNVFGSYSVQTCLMIDRAATEWQREELLIPLVQGDIHVAFAVTEPGAASSDPTNITTTAVLDGDEWVINGTKWYTAAQPTPNGCA